MTALPSSQKNKVATVRRGAVAGPRIVKVQSSPALARTLKAVAQPTAPTVELPSLTLAPTANAPGIPAEPSRAEHLIATSRRHRFFSILLMINGLAVGALAFTPPLARRTFPDAAASWWILAAVAAAGLLLVALSLALLGRARSREALPPLERNEPEPLDYDDPWRPEATA